MTIALHILRGLVDPRGRASRFGYFLTLFVAMVLTQAIQLYVGPWDFSSFNPAMLSIYAIIIWSNSVPNMRRLHDAGYSGWWFWAGLPFLMILSAIATFSMITGISLLGGEPFVLLETGQPLYYVLISIVIAPLAVAAFWISAVKGQPQHNRYGPIVSKYGLSWPQKIVDVPASIRALPTP